MRIIIRRTEIYSGVFVAMVSYVVKKLVCVFVTNMFHHFKAGNDIERLTEIDLSAKVGLSELSKIELLEFLIVVVDRLFADIQTKILLRPVAITIEYFEHLAAAATEIKNRLADAGNLQNMRPSEIVGELVAVVNMSLKFLLRCELCLVVNLLSHCCLLLFRYIFRKFPRRKFLTCQLTERRVFSRYTETGYRCHGSY